MDLKTISATLALLGTGLAFTGCDSKDDKAKADEKAPAKADADKPAKEVPAKADAKADAKGEMKCAEGMCAPGACGGKKDDGDAKDAKADDGDDGDDGDDADGDAEDKT